MKQDTRLAGLRAALRIIGNYREYRRSEEDLDRASAITLEKIEQRMQFLIRAEQKRLRKPRGKR